MYKYLLLAVLSGLLFSCKGKKKTLADGDEKVELNDFIEFFQPLKVPVVLSDSLFVKKDRDSSAIGYSVFRQFVPDTVITKYLGAGANPRITALGKVTVKKGETYLFVKAATAIKKLLYVICLDKEGEFSVAKPLLVSDNDPLTSGFAGMDTKYTLTITHQRKAADGQLYYKKDAYIYSEGVFILILTESNEGSPRGVSVINPIDTLAHKHKFTGDYAQDKKNFISVRDGKDPSRIQFFVHFEKNDGECKGELKGIARFVTANMARYTSNGDPCTIEFTFGAAGVSMKEIQGCGNYRDIKCFFEGYYNRKKETKPKPAKKPSK